MNKKSKDIIFILLISLSLIFIICFNYIVDPYDVIKMKDNKNFVLIDYPRDIQITAMKQTRGIPYDIAIVGGSPSATFFDDNIANLIDSDSSSKKALLITEDLSYKTTYELLNLYTEIHPETKKIIFLVEYFPLFITFDESLKLFKGKNLKLQEKVRLFLSISSTKESIKKVIRKLKKKNGILNDPYIYVKPKRSYEFENNFYYDDFVKAINLLDEKGIDYVFVILPYHPLFLHSLYIESNKTNQVNKIKEFLVTKNKKIYDMGIVSKWSSQPIEGSLLYLDICHPFTWRNNIWFNFLENPEKYKDILYFDLNKNNLKEMLNKEQELLNNYTKENSQLIREFIEYEDDELYLMKKPIEKMTEYYEKHSLPVL